MKLLSEDKTWKKNNDLRFLEIFIYSFPDSECKLKFTVKKSCYCDRNSSLVLKPWKHAVTLKKAQGG